MINKIAVKVLVFYLIGSRKPFTESISISHVYFQNSILVQKLRLNISILKVQLPRVALLKNVIRYHCPTRTYVVVDRRFVSCTHVAYLRCISTSPRMSLSHTASRARV